MKEESGIFLQVLFTLCIIFKVEGWGMNTLLVPMDSIVGPGCECGKVTGKVEDERLAKVKIAGGRLPWLAELVITSDGAPSEDSDEFLLCFGTVVSLQTVLFPASCIQRNFYTNTGRSKPRVKLLGMDNWKQSLQEISNIRVHSGYRKKFDNDVALVRLRNGIDFNQTGVVPICLPPEPERYYSGFGLDDSNHRNTSNQTETEKIINRAKKPSYVLEHSVIRTWFYRKAAGYDYIPHYGCFQIEIISNSTYCRGLFPEMLQSKVGCVQPKEIKDIVKQNQYFFKQLELGIPIMLSNTTLVKGKPQPTTSKFYLEGIRAPGRHGLPLLKMRENAMSMMKIKDYVRWIKESSGYLNFCTA